MTHERFEALAEAYGGDVARWPAAEQDAAALLIATEPQFARAALAVAAELDFALDAWAPLQVSPALREAVIAAAPRPRRGLSGWFWRAGLGAGLAAACAAGLVVGVKVSDAVSLQSEETVSAALGSYDDLSGLMNGEGA